MNGLLTILILIIAGNGGPIMVRYVLGERVRQPVDCHWKFFDGRRLFGDSKTWIGLVSIPLVSLTTAWMLGESVSTGLWVGLGVMCGDLFSSFVKRRLGRDQSSMAIGLDQIPESLFPLLLVKEFVGGKFDFTWLEIASGVVIFIVFELLVSQLLYRMHIRKQPY